MIAFEKGKEFPLGDLRGMEGVFFDYDDSNLARLTFAFPHMTDREIDAILTGQGKIGLLMYMGVIFVSAKIGGIDGDCAYHVGMHRNQDISVDTPQDGEGMQLHIYAVNSTDNTFQGARICGMGTKWTRDFGRMVEEQKKAGYDETSFLTLVRTCQDRWSTKELMRLSQTYKLGTHIEEPPKDKIEY